MRRPLNGSPAITQVFGANAVDYAQFGLKGHHGVDYGVGTGTPVYAPEAGRIEFSQNGLTDKYSGRFAAGETIVLVGKYEHWLMHLSRRDVSAGQQVSEGQQLGLSGATGFVTGPHLHWGTRPLQPDINNGYRGFIDPALVLFAQPAPAPAPPQGGTIMNPEAGTELYRTALHREPESPGVAGQWNGQSPAQALRSVRGGEWQTLHARLSAYAQLEQSVRDRDAVIIELRKTLEDTSARTNAEKQELINKVADLTTEYNEVKAAADAEKKRLEEELAKAQADQDEAVKGFFSRLVDALLKFVKRGGGDETKT